MVSADSRVLKYPPDLWKQLSEGSLDSPPSLIVLLGTFAWLCLQCHLFEEKTESPHIPDLQGVGANDRLHWMQHGLALLSLFENIG